MQVRADCDKVRHDISQLNMRITVEKLVTYVRESALKYSGDGKSIDLQNGTSTCQLSIKGGQLEYGIRVHETITHKEIGDMINTS